MPTKIFDRYTTEKAKQKFKQKKHKKKGLIGREYEIKTKSTEGIDFLKRGGNSFTKPRYTAPVIKKINFGFDDNKWWNQLQDFIVK